MTRAARRVMIAFSILVFWFGFLLGYNVAHAAPLLEPCDCATGATWVTKWDCTSAPTQDGMPVCISWQERTDV
jgi:hypothetical protein